MTESSQPYFNDVISRLAEAWSRRSPAERAAFADRLPRPPAPPEQGDAALRTVRERAALCGAVVPYDLARGLDQADAYRALDVLAPEFDRVHVAGAWKWTLRTAPRREALTGLAASGRLTGLLADVAAIRTDQAGQLLRRLAESWPLRRASVAPGDQEESPATLVQALTWARPLGGFDQDLAQAQRRAAVRLLSEGYSLLAPHGVFGREEVLAELRDFAKRPASNKTGDDFPIPLLTLTGVGGAGKSTVLGALVKPYLEQIEAGESAGPAVVVIDFDRVIFRPSAVLELSFDVTRQLGYAAPAAAAGLADLRGDFRDRQRRSGTDHNVGHALTESTGRESTAFELEARHLVQAHGLDERPVLLVLDTFEEWQRERPEPDAPPMSWRTPEGQILRWIYGLYSSMGLSNLRVIVSGRASLPQSDDGHTFVSSQRFIGDLDQQSAHKLLAALGVQAKDAAKLADFVGGNPLTLHVAARFYQGLSEESRQELVEGEPLYACELEADIRKAVLYERFLDHIPDKQVRKLAHPGLLLRRITPELVREVLAGPCELGELTESQAEELTRRLADEVWLVDRRPDGLYHRREVRRPMLRLMASDPAYAEVARRISLAAVDWYEHHGHGRDPLSADQSAIEAFYHRLMMTDGEGSVVPPPGPDRQRWVALAHQLGPAVDELPDQVAAQVRVLRGDRIRDQDAKSLPDEVWPIWAERRGQALVDNTEPIAALELLSLRPHPVIPGWLAQASCDSGQWGRFWEITREAGRTWAANSSASDRYAMLDAMLSGNRLDQDSYHVALAEYFDALLADARRPAVGSAERLFGCLISSLGRAAGPPEIARRLAFAAAAAGRIPTLGAAESRTKLDKLPVDQLRRIMSWVATPEGAQDFAIDNPASFFRPDPRWMRDFAVFLGASELPDSGSDLAARELTTQELLGTCAISYERSLGQAPITLRRVQVRRAADLIYVLRGDNPELRPAIQLALAGLAEEKGLRELAGIAQEVVPVLGTDLRPSAVAGTEDVRRVLIQLVEYVDRSGAMRPFLARARRLWPEAAMLRRVTRAFDIWDDANLRLMASLDRTLRNVK